MRSKTGLQEDSETPGTKKKRAHQRKMIKEHRMSDNDEMICKGAGWGGRLVTVRES